MKHVNNCFAGISALLISILLISNLFTYTVHGKSPEPTPGAIPTVTNVMQIAPDTLKITFDQKIEVKKAIDPNSYWVQDLSNEIPEGIASLGSNEEPSSTNTLAQVFATIIPADDTASAFLIKFSDSIITGADYRLIICFLSAPSGGEYTGENGKLDFTGK